MHSISVPFAFCLAVSLAAFAGCSGKTSGGNLPGSAGAAGSGTSSGGRQKCGPVTCPRGQLCCSVDCGVCAPTINKCPAAVDCAPFDAGPPVPCGNATCHPGDVCCDVCGTKTCVQGSLCPGDAACTPDCRPQDAQGVGTCNVLFGYRWAGGSCAQVGGCSCQGTDCGKLFQNEQSCYDAHPSCPQFFN